MRYEVVSPAKKRAMIKRDNPELSISQQCKLVCLSRSAFYNSEWHHYALDQHTPEEAYWAGREEQKAA